MQELKADVLVVGGSTGGTAAALQAARRGAKTILVSEFSWLGGMLTSAGVSAPDGNELLAFQTGIWGAFLKALQQRQPEGLDHGWVSFFTYDPRVGAEIFADWVAELPNLQWIAGQVPLEVLRQGDRITGVRFAEFSITAQITLDGTELGDLLALAEVPYRWGWELQAEWNEPSAPVAPNKLTKAYPVQAPTWVVIMQDFGPGATAPEIELPPNDNPEIFLGAWDDYGGETFLNYGRLPENRFMINWPNQGNDYGEGTHRLVESDFLRQQFFQEARWHSQSFARFIQMYLDRRYGLAEGIFPEGIGTALGVGGGAYGLHPYFRESRRLIGLTTVREQDILPIANGHVAPLPMDESGQVTAIAVGNYANDHHYPNDKIELQPKSLRWGGRWTGTPFTIPYSSLIPAQVEGLLVCEKNISVSHIANGATRLQPVVLGIGQAAGMAAALCVEHNCQPRELPVRSLQAALLQDSVAAAAIIPLFNVPPSHPDWLHWQSHYLKYPENYSTSGMIPDGKAPDKHTVQIQAKATPQNPSNPRKTHYKTVSGIFQKTGEQAYCLEVTPSQMFKEKPITLVTLSPVIDSQLQEISPEQPVTVSGRVNLAGNWLLVEKIDIPNHGSQLSANS